MDQFFQGVADCYLGAQNMVNAIESLGLGSLYLGSILNDSKRMIEILDLPELTFPILGLAFGYPNDNPQLKPRIDLSVKVGENGYPHQDDYLKALADFDQAMTHYYDTREKNQRSDSYTNQILTRANLINVKRSNMMKVVESQGFLLEVDE